jgi:hypothetical protein
VLAKLSAELIHQLFLAVSVVHGGFHINARSLLAVYLKFKKYTLYIRELTFQLT